LLTQDYFDSLVPASTNKYAKYVSHDEAQPVKSQAYENTFSSPEELSHSKDDVICVNSEKKSVTSKVWKGCFPKKFYEYEYGNGNEKSVLCTFEIIIDLYHKKEGVTLTTNQIKTDLVDTYRPYLEKYKDKILHILIREKNGECKKMGETVKLDKSGMDLFSLFINEDSYFLTTLDLWVLVDKYQIPTIFISDGSINLFSREGKNLFLGYGNRENEEFAFIVLPQLPPSKNTKPKYKNVRSEAGSTFISLDKINSDCVERIYEAIENHTTIEAFLQRFTK
jgi:hypothetical protein